MKKIFSIVFLALVVSGTLILGDVREAKADGGWSPYAMDASVSLYFYYCGQPYSGFYVELIDPRQTDEENPVQSGWTDANGHIAFRNTNVRHQIRFTTPMGNVCVQDIITSMGVIELAEWR
ncbi:MAG: hypothetical protein IJE69_05870 [Alistipes sp.]|nr:hypothetical protein [Alistipes sp.]